MNIRSKLAQKHQQTFGKNLTQSVVSIKGMGHIPVITVQYTTEWGDFQMEGAPGQNKKQLFNELAKEICKDHNLKL